VKRKIVIIGSAYPLRGGGISTFNERLAKAFQDQGDDTTIYNFSLQYPNIFFPGKTQYSSEPAPENIHIVTKINSVNPISWLKVGKELKKLKPDLVVIRYWIPFMAPCLGTIARRIRKNKHTRIIAITDNVIPHEHRLGDMQLTHYFTKSVDAFLTMSSAVMEDLGKFDQVKPRALCLHPLYDNFGDAVPKSEAKKMLGLNENERFLLSFGMVRDYKGLDLLLVAMTDQRIREMKLKLIVAGEFYADYEAYKKYVVDNKLEDVVIMENEFIPNTDVFKYFCASDLVVQPYKTATQSGVTQVAYHFDKAMVVTNVGALPQMVPDGKVGYVVNPDGKEIADAIVKYYEEDKEEEFTQHVMQEKKRYSWEKLTGALFDLASQIEK
jgi:glycosyltransferase involved in cell wall biosynthesis